MRRASTALVVAAIALLGILAAADALRSDGRPAREPAAATTTRERPPTLGETLREELIFGRMLYSDPDCRVHSLVLPRMTDTLVFDEDDRQVFRCRFDSTDGRILEEGEHLSPDWRFTARCHRGEIVVRGATNGVVKRRLDGCALAWRPPVGNVLTWARGAAIYEDGRALLHRKDLLRAVRRNTTLADVASGVRVRLRVTDLAWFDVDHLIVSVNVNVRFGGRFPAVVLFEGVRPLLASPGFFRDWIVSPAGSFAAAAGGPVVTLDGDLVDLPNGLPLGRAAAFSPDERWLAYVSGQSIYVVGTPRNNEPGRIIRLPVAARDLAWELLSQAPQVGPPIRR